MRKIFAWGGAGVVSLFLLQAAWAGVSTKEDKVTLVVDKAFSLAKPDRKWDTQKVKKNANIPLRLVLHQAGRDPTIELRYQDSAAGKKFHNLNQLTEGLKKDYKLQGITVEKIEKKNIHGQPVALLHGFNPYKDERFLVGAWLEKGKGYILECSSLMNDFTAMKPHFEKVIDTARILK